MLILTIKTDQSEAQIGLLEDDKKIDEVSWQAHRQLAETIHLKIEKLLTDNDKSWQDLGGIICFEGPGSFTGLRIGLTVGNSLAYGLKIPIIAESGEKWIKQGTIKLLAGKNDKVALPKYGALANITKPKR